MSDSEKIICKPTPWFLVRMVVVFLMFSVFAFLFYRDGSIGYRRKNASYYLREAFIKADQEFKSKRVNLTAAEWRKLRRGGTGRFRFAERPATGRIGAATGRPARHEVARIPAEHGD
ncbi:MAG: hypothetical protein QM755_05745 [Luteolibacter sp.]